MLRKCSSSKIHLLFDCLASLILIWAMDRLLSNATSVHGQHISLLVYYDIAVLSLVWLLDMCMKEDIHLEVQ